MLAIFRPRLREPLVSLRNVLNLNAALLARGSLRTRTTAADDAFQHRGTIRSWSQDEIDTMLRLHQEGANFREIAKQLHRGADAVEKRLESALKYGKIVAMNPREIKVWTDQEQEQLRRLQEQGDSIREIAAVLGRSTASVESRLWREKERNSGVGWERGLHLSKPFEQGDFERIRDMRGQGDSWRTIASRMGRTMASVRRHYVSQTAKQTAKFQPKSFTFWTSGEDEALMDLMRQGKSPKEIATRLPGRTVIAIKNRYEKHLVRSGVQKDMHGKPWTLEELQKLRLLRETGVPLAEIATRLGRSKRSVSGKYWYLLGSPNSPARKEQTREGSNLAATRAEGP